MDRATRVARCACFIAEFGDEYRRKFGFGVGRRLVVVRELLGYDDHDECVRFQVTARPETSDEEIRFMLEPVFFAPEDESRDQVAQVADDLEIDPDEVRRRFAVARLAGRRR
ncbi:MAG: hypothetical protein HY905_04065 [Deltaproteobacteria bacterium]|nr:hypothetical protein [Deltaproteobacteria bacterium]